MKSVFPLSKVLSVLFFFLCKPSKSFSFISSSTILKYEQSNALSNKREHPSSKIIVKESVPATIKVRIEEKKEQEKLQDETNQNYYNCLYHSEIEKVSTIFGKNRNTIPSDEEVQFETLPSHRSKGINNQVNHITQRRMLPALLIASSPIIFWLSTKHFWRNTKIKLNVAPRIYMTALKKFPLPTKAVTAGIISFLGDFTAQLWENRNRNQVRNKSDSAEKNNELVEDDQKHVTPTKSYDARRGLSVMGNSIVVTAPLLHYLYGQLDKFMMATPFMHFFSSNNSIQALIQVMIDDVFFDTLFVLIAYIMTGLGEGYKLSQIWKNQIRTSNFISTVKMGWKTSLLVFPLEFVCFRFLPVSLRVLGMNMIDLIWDGIVSFMIHKNRNKVVEEGGVMGKDQEEDDKKRSISQKEENYIAVEKNYIYA